MLGGVVAMSSTVLIVQQLTERAELNRTHGRLAFSVLLFQDIAVVPFLALAAALAPGGEAFTMANTLKLVGAGTLAVLVVLAAGRWLLRPLLYVIANSRLRELFTLAVLLVALSSAWASHLAGLSMALGGFLAGMMLAETEYRHQVESVIRPFRDILLGLFFISVGMLLDFHALWRELWLILALLVAMVVVKTVIAGVRHARCSWIPTSRRCAPASRWPWVASSASRCSRCCCRTRPSIPPSRSRCWWPWCWPWCWRR